MAVMNSTSLYITSNQIILKCDPNDLSTWQDLYRVVPDLRNSLCCVVCGNLLIDPQTPTIGKCQHHLCRKCEGGKKKIKPACVWCKHCKNYSENKTLRILLQCYKSMCIVLINCGIFQRLVEQTSQSNIAWSVQHGADNLIVLIKEGAAFQDDSQTDVELSKSVYNTLPCTSTNFSNQTLQLNQTDKTRGSNKNITIKQKPKESSNDTKINRSQPVKKDSLIKGILKKPSKKFVLKSHRRSTATIPGKILVEQTSQSNIASGVQHGAGNRKVLIKEEATFQDDNQADVRLSKSVYKTLSCTSTNSSNQTVKKDSLNKGIHKKPSKKSILKSHRGSTATIPGKLLVEPTSQSNIASGVQHGAGNLQVSIKEEATFQDDNQADVRLSKSVYKTLSCTSTNSSNQTVKKDSLNKGIHKKPSKKSILKSHRGSTATTPGKLLVEPISQSNIASVVQHGAGNFQVSIKEEATFQDDNQADVRLSKSVYKTLSCTSTNSSNQTVKKDSLNKGIHKKPSKKSILKSHRGSTATIPGKLLVEPTSQSNIASVVQHGAGNFQVSIKEEATFKDDNQADVRLSKSVYKTLSCTSTNSSNQTVKKDSLNKGIDKKPSKQSILKSHRGSTATIPGKLLAEPTSQSNIASGVQRGVGNHKILIKEEATFQDDNQTDVGLSKSVYNTLPCTSTNSSNQTLQLNQTDKTRGSSTKITIKQKPKKSSTDNKIYRSRPVKNDSLSKGILKNPSKECILKSRHGCLCGSTATIPGKIKKITCFGTRCPCYVASKPCMECKCRGCRNPYKVQPVTPHIHIFQPISLVISAQEQQPQLQKLPLLLPKVNVELAPTLTN